MSGICPKCHRWPPPAGYTYCRSCTFGENSREGRVERIWAGVVRGKTSTEQALSAEADLMGYASIDDYLGIRRRKGTQ